MNDVLLMQARAFLRDFDIASDIMKEYDSGRINGFITALFALDILDGIQKYCDNDYELFRKMTA